MRSVLALSLLGAMIAMSSAHLCLINPKQRGSLQGLDTKGSNDCILLNAPCGGRPGEESVTKWKSGGNYTVIFQKNLDHWVQATPGYFALTMMNGGSAQELTRVPDNGEPSLNLYTASGTLPTNLANGDYILQVTYVTKNAQAPAVFFQCADVTVS